MVKLDDLREHKKDTIRREILARLRLQTRQDRIIKSDKIKRRLLKEKCFRDASLIMFYVSKSYEVDTTGMIEEALKRGKRVVVPVTQTKEKQLIPSEITCPARDLVKGPFGVMEPRKECIKAVNIEDIDLVIVPGIAFDSKGNRIGHGQGYFDRFLRRLPNKIPTIGLAFKLQLTRRIKALPWDIPVTKLIAA
ncbi:MAG: 5-formyltetrahydrofolate cyclo-ligase [Candidatus Omnitrophica bacterium]|nr:5-formyltetrahydrofolate cyclo-ligase [Candidatus Omnitrophota bacterium]